MALLVMLGWWYTQGWLWIIDITRHRLQAISRTFAVGVLVQTWFAPWKQIQTRSNSFQNFFPNLIDNTVSRVIGSVVRGTILVWAFFLSIVVLFVGVMSLIAWPFIPILTIILPIFTLSGVLA